MTEPKKSSMKTGHIILLSLLVLAFFGTRATIVSAQSLGSYERERGKQILRTVKDKVLKNYYDANYRGVDLEARFKEAEEAIKNANSNSQIFMLIASILIDLNDSHTFFIPPARVNRVEYGWQMQMIGDKCFVTAVEPKSDAEKKGLREGDQILNINGIAPAREIFWQIGYLIYTLQPMEQISVVLQSPDGKRRELAIKARIVEGQRVKDLTNYTEYMRLLLEEDKEARVNTHRYVEISEDVFIWKMPRFDLPKEKVDEMMDKARKFKALVLDLRGNGGGAEETLLRLIGHFVEKDTKIGDLTRRKESKPLTAKTAGDRLFKGKLVVLIDSGSGSSSELFARVMQLEKRATIVGDRSAGAVMRSRQYPEQIGIDTVTLFSVSVTDADLIMTDGKSLEHIGVMPDETMFPSPTDMASKRDPVLANAIKLAGVQISTEKAGSLFPIQWRSK